MKKLILAGAIATLCSGAVVAAEETKTQEEGVRFTVPVGPFYDPIFDFAGSVIPTFLYETTEGAETSQTSLYGIYGTNGNWVLKANSNNYFGSNSEWLVFGDVTYTYSVLDLANELGAYIGDTASTAEIEQTSLVAEFKVGYQIFEDAYFGPSIKYVNSEFADADYRSSGDKSDFMQYMMPDSETKGMGAFFTLDKRNDKMLPTDGMYFSATAMNIELEKTNGGSLNNSDFDPDILFGSSDDKVMKTLNGEFEYYNVKADLRYYMPIGDTTTLAFRAQANINGDEAGETEADLSTVAHGFTFEVAGKSAYGTDLQVRHWLSNEIGVVGTVALAKATDVREESRGGDDGIHYSVGAGLRYMLVPEDSLALRLDVTYNDQEDDNVLVFFNVGETF